MEGLTINEAAEILLKKTERITETEEIGLWEASGRVLPEELYAAQDQPPFPRSPLDGYAVRSEDIREASSAHPVRLSVIDEVIAGGCSEKTLAPGTAVRIMTGAKLPDGADCVVGQEDTDYGEEEVAVFHSVAPWQNYCFAGEDYRKGSQILPKGTVLGAVETGLAASCGMERLKVLRRPRAALLTTGNEIVMPGQPLPKGKIYDSNLYTIGTRLKEWGAALCMAERASDDAGEVAERIRRASEQADLIITTGGVSVGKMDIMHDVMKLPGFTELFWRIAVKPGMPTLCGMIGGKLLICLSGNPFGAAVNTELLVRPVIAKLSGRTDLALCRKTARSESEFLKKSGVTRYIRAVYRDGSVRIPEGSNASGIMHSMLGCNCLIELPAGTKELKKGTAVQIVML